MFILIKRVDGGVSVMDMPLPDSEAPEGDALQALISAEVAKWATTNQGYLSHQVIDAAAIPQDRTFRNAWGHDLAVDMTKAREIHRQNLRELRAPLMTAADIEFTRALETGDTAKQRAAGQRRQALRDVTAHPAIDAARTPEALKAAIPDVLK
jgi:hypothetical protein